MHLAATEAVLNSHVTFSIKQEFDRINQIAIMLWDKDNAKAESETGEARVPASDAEPGVGLLQEWFGFCLLPDTSHHKIAILIGPPRSGPGTIARVMAALIGHENVAGPRLTALGTNFGLEPLIGKPATMA
jgi:putative DNA primase/helicase